MASATISRPRAHRRRACRLALVAASITASITASVTGASVTGSPAAAQLAWTSVAPVSPAAVSAAQPSRGSRGRGTQGVVDIYTKVPGATGAGTGIVLSSTGEVVTNNHVIAGAGSITAVDPSTGRHYQAELVGADAAHDVAVLALSDASDLTAAHIGSQDAEVGDRVKSIGNAGGKGGAPKVTSGTVTALGRCVNAHDEFRNRTERLCGLIQASVRILGGDSGGPMVGDDGVVGMNVAADAQNGYAIPIETVLAAARGLD